MTSNTLKQAAILTAATLAAGILVALVVSQPAPAADLGGNCCADLEDRIAELEATTARKAGKKVSVTIYGTINKALVSYSGDVPSTTRVTENSTDETFVGFAVSATIAPGWKAGGTLEIGAGGYDQSLKNGIGYGPLLNGDTNELYTRRASLYIESAQIGRLTIGHDSQATDGIVELNTANIRPAHRALSVRPITGPQIGDVLDLMDGTRADVVRYDSPLFAGARLSASWTQGGIGPINTGDVWDVALRWRGEGAGFLATAGVGYREGIVIPTIGALGSIGPIDPKVFSGSASIKHIETGLFVTGAAGRLDLGPVDVTTWELQGGIERKFNALGETTIFALYSDWGDLDLNYWGAGVVQHIDAAAMDLYATAKNFSIGGGDATELMVGAKINF